MTTTKLYQVRFYNGNDYSKQVGSKQRLVARPVALRIVKRLKRAGVNAFAAPIKVAA